MRAGRHYSKGATLLVWEDVLKEIKVRKDKYSSGFPQACCPEESTFAEHMQRAVPSPRTVSFNSQNSLQGMNFLSFP